VQLRGAADADAPGDTAHAAPAAAAALTALHLRNVRPGSRSAAAGTTAAAAAALRALPGSRCLRLESSDVFEDPEATCALARLSALTRLEVIDDAILDGHP
jgi:hypothetical protein